MSGPEENHRMDLRGVPLEERRECAPQGGMKGTTEEAKEAAFKGTKGHHWKDICGYGYKSC